MTDLFIVRSGLGRSVRGRWEWRCQTTSLPCTRKVAEHEAKRLEERRHESVRDDRDRRFKLAYLVVVEPAEPTAAPFAHGGASDLAGETE